MQLPASIRFRKIALFVAIAASSVLPLLFVRLDEPTTSLNIYKLLAKTGSLVGSVLVIWQFLLGFRGAASRVLIDLLWVIDVHKFIGKYLVPLILLHPVFITIYYLVKYDVNLLLLVGRPYIAMGYAALAIFVLVVITSIWLRSRLSMLTWYSVHLSSYVAAPLVFVHSFAIGQTVRDTWLGVYWWALAAVAILFAAYRLARRIGVGNCRHKVVRARRAGPGVTEISVRPMRCGIAPAIGQFVYFRQRASHYASPFTVSGFDADTRELTITVKAQGPTTTRLQEIRPDETVLVDGPYGVFPWDALGSNRPLVMVAGGIGITPFRRLCLEGGQRLGPQAWLFYGNQSEHDIIYKAELEAVENLRVVHVLSEQDDYPGETGFITAELIKKYVPGDLPEYEFLICGPPVMTRKLESDLGEHGVVGEQIHHELFSY